MEMYQPYFTKVANSLISPFLSYILESSIAEWRVDYYAPHLGISFFSLQVFSHLFFKK
jgi:hypothetical protein